MKYIITVKALLPEEELHELDREENPVVGEHIFEADSEEEALDEFHNTVPIKVPENFDITVASSDVFTVTVEKTMYCSGTVKVKGVGNSEQALKKVNAMIANGELQTTDIDWGDLMYECASFGTTGDVE